MTDYSDIIEDVEKLIAGVWKREDLTRQEKQLVSAVLGDVLATIKFRARKPR